VRRERSEGPSARRKAGGCPASTSSSSPGPRRHGGVAENPTRSDASGRRGTQAIGCPAPLRDERRARSFREPRVTREKRRTRARHDQVGTWISWTVLRTSTERPGDMRRAARSLPPRAEAIATPCASSRTGSPGHNTGKKARPSPARAPPVARGSTDGTVDRPNFFPSWPGRYDLETPPEATHKRASRARHCAGEPPRAGAQNQRANRHGVDPPFAIKSSRARPALGAAPSASHRSRLGKRGLDSSSRSPSLASAEKTRCG
jgi:hypothetical protein